MILPSHSDLKILLGTPALYDIAFTYVLQISSPATHLQAFAEKGYILCFSWLLDLVPSTLVKVSEVD